MPRPTLGQGQTYELPPPEIKTINAALYDYLFMLHIRIFGSQGGQGSLAQDNITVPHNSVTGVDKYQHHGSDDHGDISQAKGLDFDVTERITSADADLLYDLNEVAVINELKADFNILAAHMDSLVRALRKAKLIGPPY